MGISHYIRIDENHAVLIESLSKQTGKNHNFKSDFILTHDEFFNDNGNIVVCLKIALRKKGAQKLFNRIFQMKKYECHIVDYELQFSNGYKKDITGCYRNSLEIPIEDYLEGERNGKENAYFINLLQKFDMTLADCANINNIKRPFFT